MADGAAVLLFSGGIDSTTALYWGLNRFSPLETLIFDYGQRHVIEIKLAEKVVSGLGIPYRIVQLPLGGLVSSALTDDSQDIPELIPEDSDSVPVTYVPFRNGIFLALAAAYGESRGITRIITGFNVIDSPDYPDTTPEFVESMEAAINRGTSATRTGRPFKILAPLIGKTKSEIIAWGRELGADYSNSITCYRGREIPCLKCPSCRTRAEAFGRINMTDPLIARLEKEGKI